MTLCEGCRHLRNIVSGKGSRFLLCQRALTDKHFAKYPVQPVRGCTGFEPHAMSRENLVHDLSVHVGQPEVTALEAVRQPLVVEAELMQDGGVQIVNVDLP